MAFAFGGVAVAAIASGWAARSGVVQVGDGRFLVTRQAATGLSGLGTLKADAVREAEAYCKALGKGVEVMRADESKPPYVLGNFPRAEIEFACR